MSCKCLCRTAVGFLLAILDKQSSDNAQNEAEESESSHSRSSSSSSSRSSQSEENKQFLDNSSIENHLTKTQANPQLKRMATETRRGTVYIKNSKKFEEFNVSFGFASDDVM